MSEETETKEPKFKVGDVVRLRCGGPLMVVITQSDDDGDCECRWFKAHEGEHCIIEDGYFNDAVLTK